LRRNGAEKLAPAYRTQAFARAVALAPGKTGQIRVELKGQSVDLLATTDEEELARGEAILIEEIEGSVARVSRRPRELE